jgi:dTDP-4-amino-4,6-dideoxygalactose transaminase
MNAHKIPFLDLVTVHQELESELIEVVKTALASGAFVGGPMVQGFEQDFAAFCQSQFCVGVGSGTDALRFALIAAGVRWGDVVVTVPNTFIATTEAISQSGGRPDFVDVDEKTCTLDPTKLREYLESQCRWDSKSQRCLHKESGSPVTAVVPVHLYGQVADMDPIVQLAAEYNLKVIEDACQAQGAEYFSTKEHRWLKAGSIGHAAAFSFYPGKNLGACGEAGAITTDDEQIAQTCRLLREHGQLKKYHHEIEGYNGRLDAIQAGFLQVKLRHLRRWNEQRREIAEQYRKSFVNMEGAITLPYQPEWARSVFHLYVIRVDDRVELQAKLNELGIGSGIHYPVPLHLTKAYAGLGLAAGTFPVAEKAASHVLSLPMFPHLTVHQQERVAQAVVQFLVASSSIASRPAGHG